MRVHYLLLVVLCLFAFIIRIINIDDHGIAGDEKNSFFVSQFVPIGGANQQDVFRKPDNPYFTPREFWKPKGIADFYEAGARVDNGSSAAHALLLHYWTDWFGRADGTLRMLSVLFSVLLIPLLYFFVLSLFRSEKLALGVAALACIEPMYVGWSQVVRTYTMTFFFCLLATHLFFQIIRAEEAKKRPVWLYVGYGVCAFVCLMCHYSVFTLFLLHGLLLLLFHRNFGLWLRFSLAMLIPVLGMVWWLTTGGGHSAFMFIEDSKRVYNEMATRNPQLGYLAPTTPFTVFYQLLPVISNHYLPINGFFDALVGKKNILLAIFVTLVILGTYRFVRHRLARILIPVVLLAAAFPIYTTSNILYTCLPASIILLLLIIQDTVNQKGEERRTYLSMWILSAFPILFLAMYAVQDHNTFRIQHKYAGYGIAFSLILVALGIRKLWTYPDWVKYSVTALLLIQLGFIGKTIQSIWADTAPRYLLFSTPRIYNPHRTVAQRIMRQYAPGDTILYPSYISEDYDYTVAPPDYPITDAQLVNFYLPKDAQYWQRINPLEPNKVYLKKADGTRQILFDFKGPTYRY